MLLGKATLQALKCQCEWVCQMPVRPLYLVPKGNTELEKGGAREVCSELNLPSFTKTHLTAALNLTARTHPS